MLTLVLLNCLKMMNVQFPLGSHGSCNLKTESEIVRKAFLSILKSILFCLSLSLQATYLFAFFTLNLLPKSFLVDKIHIFCIDLFFNKLSADKESSLMVIHV